MTTPRAPLAVALALGALGGFSAGALLFGDRTTSLPVAPAREPARAARPQPVADSGELLPALASLEAAVREMTRSLAAAAAAAAPRRAVPAREDADEAALARLERLLRELVLAVRSSPAVPAGGARPTSSSPERSVAALDRPQLSDAEDSRTARDAWRRERLHAHLLWTYADVLRAYGPPDESYLIDAGMVWKYSSPAGEDHRFRFVDGLVARID